MSSAGLSNLLTASTAWPRALLSSLAITASASVTPSLASVRCKTTSASSTATLACRVTRASRPTFARGSIPPVSTSVNSLPAHSARLYALSRVVPGRSETTAPRRRMILFTSELFPTFGAPTTATTGSRFTETPACKVPAERRSCARSHPPPRGTPHHLACTLPGSDLTGNSNVAVGTFGEVSHPPPLDQEDQASDSRTPSSALAVHWE